MINIMNGSAAVKLKDVLAARERICQFVKATPLLTSSEADRKAGRQLFFKSEHLQSTGSFKVRGALNAVSFPPLFRPLFICPSISTSLVYLPFSASPSPFLHLRWSFFTCPSMYLSLSLPLPLILSPPFLVSPFV